MSFGDMNDTINEFDVISARIEITSSDSVLRKVSGNFSGVVGDVSCDTMVITNGVFTNVAYQDL